MFKIRLSVLFLLLALQGTFGQKQQLNLLFVGDVMQHDGQIAAAYNEATQGYDYKDCFKFVKPIISQADLAIANLEVTHAGKPYKGYPQFSAPPSLSEAIVDAGFNLIITANNHACDGGAKGIIGTLDVLDRLKVKHTGTFRNQKERDANYPLLIEKNGFRIAVLNYTFSTNGLSVAKPLIVNYIDSATMKADFAKAKRMKVDYIICTLHWGAEYLPLPTSYQKNWEKFCYDHGADMVIGSHPHVLEPIEQKTVAGEEKLTAWSLGNFISNQRDRYKNGGIMLRSFLEKDSTSVKIQHTDYILTWVYPHDEGLTKPYYLLPDFPYNAYAPGFLTETALAQMNQYFKDSRELFALHNQKTTEVLISNLPELPLLYQKFMMGYFAVVLEEQNLPQFNTSLVPELKHEARQFTKSDGSYALLYGMYATKEEAFGDLNFLRDIGIIGKKVVWVNPSSLSLTQQQP